MHTNIYIKYDVDRNEKIFAAVIFSQKKILLKLAFKIFLRHQDLLLSLDPQDDYQTQSTRSSCHSSKSSSTSTTSITSIICRFPWVNNIVKKLTNLPYLRVL